MAENVTYYLSFQGSDGKNYRAHLIDNLGWIQQRFGICELRIRIEALETKIRLQGERIQVLEQPMRMERILKVLKDQPQGRLERWISHRIPGLDVNDLFKLEQQGKVENFGKGKIILYRIKEQPT